LIRSQYSPAYTRVRGRYAPHRLDLPAIADAAFADPRALPIAVLEGTDVSIEVSRRREPAPFAQRNVLADELHYVLAGSARLETDFGDLEVRDGDFVLLPRAVTYRVSSVSTELHEIIIASASELTLDPQNAPGVLNVDLDVDSPVPQPQPAEHHGEFEVVIRHGHEFTSYFYDYDPMPVLQAIGSPIVRRFNIKNVHGLGVDEGGLMPPRLLNDATTRTMFYYLGSHHSDRPPVHHNADYDEVIFYVSGPGHYGAVDTPGTAMWTPKGITHHGPDENVPEGYKAWLLETRAALSLTPAGKDIARLMETGQFGLHPSESQLA
jgi:homogentisate 1,2-dioxygenase